MVVMPNITTNHAITYTNQKNSASITSYIPCGSDAIIFGSKIFLAHSSVFQISHDKKSSVSDIEKQQLNNNNMYIKMNKTSYSFYIFEVDNIIIIYNLLLSSLQKKNSKKDHLNRRRIVFSPYRRRTLSELTCATGRKREEDGKP